LRQRAGKAGKSSKGAGAGPRAGKPRCCAARVVCGRAPRAAASAASASRRQRLPPRWPPLPGRCRACPRGAPRQPQGRMPVSAWRGRKSTR